MTADPFDLERDRLAAAGRLRPEDFDEFQRLAKTLVHGPAFQLVFVDCRDQAYRERVIDALDGTLRATSLHADRLMLDHDVPDVAALEERLRQRAAAAGVVHVVGGAVWFDPARWDQLNRRRERLAQEARARLVFWLEAEAIAQLPRHALDLWAWRSGVYEFDKSARAPTSAASSTLALPPLTDVDARSMAERYRRLAELRLALSSDPTLARELQVPVLDEIGRLLFSLGEYDEALLHWQTTELPLHQAAHDDRAAALTWGQMADVLRDRGQLDEALRIRREEQLPVYERIGDARSRAVTMGKIAGLLQAKGELDEALRIRREEQLPAFEKLADSRERAMTMSEIADLLKARGQLDEALRLWRQDTLPTFEALGDVRSRAVTMGKIAEVLRIRGQFDEALRILREEELPVFEKLGDMRSRLVTQTNLAVVLSQRQAPGDLAEARQLLVAALADARRLHLTEAEPIEKLLNKLPAG